MARPSFDTPQTENNDLPPDLNRWFSHIADQLNFTLGRIVADRTANIGGSGAGPISVAVPGFSAETVVTASIQASSNPVSIQKATATATGFDILFSGDPGVNCTVNYIAFISPWVAQGA